MPMTTFSRVASLLTFQLLFLSTRVAGFQNCRAFNARHETVIFTTNDDENNDTPFSVPLSTESSSPIQEGFNPLAYQKGDKKANMNSATKLDIRSMRMSSLTGDLLNAIGDATATRQLLEENRDFLLEPLEVPDSLAASASDIYTPNMTRSERYQAYRENVEARLANSKNGQARAVLTAMKDFVLEFEEKGPE